VTFARDLLFGICLACEPLDIFNHVFNIGNNQPKTRVYYIALLEVALCGGSNNNYLPMQPGDFLATATNTDELNPWVGFKLNTAVKHGPTRFVDWYRDYYKV